MRKAKIASISCIKNECDIIETFVRVNSRIIDTFLFVDDSTDTTRNILKKLIKDGFRIIILDHQYSATTYDQAGLLANALSVVKDQSMGSDFDYVLPLDCDEFPNALSIESFTQELCEIPDDCIGNYFWDTYVPTSLEFSNLNENGLISCFQRRTLEGISYPKIIIPKNYLDKITLAAGSHAAHYFSGMPCKTFTIKSQLAHFPVRSPEQIIRKNFTAVYGLMRKQNRIKGEGLHVYNTMAAILNKNINLDLYALQKIACEYANNIKFSAMPGNVESLKPSWIPEYQLKYHEYSKVNFMEIFGNIIVESWLDPFPSNDLVDLCAALQSLDK